MLSGNVQASISDGNLIILGDAAANVIVLDQVGLAAHKVRISAASGTTINNQTEAIVMRGVIRGVDIRMGAGRDSVSLNDLGLPGNVLINGQRHLTLDNVRVAKTLNILGGAITTISNTVVDQDLMIRTATGGGAVALQSVDVLFETQIIGGSGSDTFTVDNSIFHGAVRLRTGSGSDLVQIERHGDALRPPTRFHQPVSTLLGTGDDTLEVGVVGESGNRSVFSNVVNFNGGAGFDALLNSDSNLFLTPSQVKIVNFESIVAAPGVSSTDPANGATGVPVNQQIAVTFDTEMDPLTITTSSFTVTGPESTLVSGTVNYIGTIATFTPDSPLAPETLYTATITTAARDLAGDPLASDFTWTFTTGATPDTAAPTVNFTDPANDATGVALNQQVGVTFWEAMDPLTITTSSFTVTGPGTTPVAGTVTYVGTTATFTPDSLLAANTTYTATITTAARDLAGNALASDFTWTFTTGATPDTTAPTVESTDPANNATGVPLNQKIAVTFWEAMDPLTITTSSFTVTGPGSTLVAGTVTYVGTTATFTPDSLLAANTTYTATITTAARDLAGNALASDFIWTFTTPDTIVPTVLSTNPTAGQTDVAINSTVAATFSEPMDPLTITPASFTVTGPGSTLVAGTVTFVGTTATFTPDSLLAANTTYTATITTAARDLAGNALASDFIWTFTTPDTIVPTVLSTNPANLQTNVALNSTVAATFSEPMNPLTITTASFTLTGPGTTPVAGTVTFVGATATFTPDSPLAANTTYTATITTAATDLAGNVLASDFIWTFTTPDTIAPTVTSTNPADLQTNVAINSTVAATFSEPMNPLPITPASFTVTGPGSTLVAGTVTYVGTTATFTPDSPLALDTVYTATITTTATDLAGNALASNFTWTFTTGETQDLIAPTVTSTNPANLQTNVALNKTVAATFSEAMDPLTITNTTFTLTAPGNILVAGTVTYDALSNTATFAPSGLLDPSAIYTATILGGLSGVKDLAGNALASDFTWTFTTGTQIAQAPIDLGVAGTFAVMATAAISGTGHITGDVGLNPGTAQGFPEADITGNIRVGGTEILAAQAALLAAYNDAVSRSTTSVDLQGNLGGLTFTPGLYTNSTSVLISGAPGAGNNVTLDAQGDPNAIFIFKMGSTLTTGPGAQVILAGGAKAGNIFWQVGSSASLDTTTIFKGNILAAVTITVNNGAVVEGRLFAGSAGEPTGAVTIDGGTVTLPLP